MVGLSSVLIFWIYTKPFQFSFTIPCTNRGYWLAENYSSSQCTIANTKKKKNCSSNSLFFTLQLNTLIRGHFHPLMDFLNSAISRLLTSVASYSTEYCSTTVWRTGCSGSRPGGLVTSIPFFTSLVAVVVVVESRMCAPELTNTAILVETVIRLTPYTVGSARCYNDRYGSAAGCSDQCIQEVEYEQQSASPRKTQRIALSHAEQAGRYV